MKCNVFWARFYNSVAGFILDVFQCTSRKTMNWEFPPYNTDKSATVWKRKKIDREKTGDMFKTDRLADLNVWEDCVSIVTETVKVSNRETRVKTSQITK